MPAFKRERPTIGVLPSWSPLIGDTPDRYLESIIRGMQTAARLKGSHLLVAWGVRRQVEVTNLFPAWPIVSKDTDFVPVGPWNADGLIVLAPVRDDVRAEYLQQLSRQGFPVLYVAAGQDGPTIASDNAEGIRRAVAHLVEHGHRRIAFIAGDPHDTGDSEFRLRGYHAAVQEFGLADDPRLVVHGWHTNEAGYLALKEMLGSKVGFTALVVSDDNSAIGAMRAIREAGLRVPNDIAIIGFDDQPDAVAQVPPLASIHVPLAEIGQQAVLLMLDHLTGQGQLESILIPTRLLPRQSCGCLPVAVLSAAQGESQAPALHDRGSQTQAIDLESIMLQIVNEMLAALPAESRLPEEENTQRVCFKLVGAFYNTLHENDAGRFASALMDFLQEMELVDLNVDLWQEIVTVLRRDMTRLPLNWELAGTRGRAEDLLHQARAAISESGQRRDLRHQSQRDSRAYLLGMLTSRLSAMLDAREVVMVLNQGSAEVGIRHARVALFEAEGDDPVAWSLMLDQDPDSPLRRFATREFPLPGMYPPEELLNLVTLPLLFQDEALGYVAFDGSDLSSVTTLARQVAAALKATGLHRQIVELSLTDPLTGLHNRRYFDLFLKNEVVRSQRFARALAVLMLDLDDLKTYNDMYGHATGDQALRKIADCLMQGRRNADVVARIGGDEFAIILPETELNGALQVANKIRSSVASVSDLERPLTISIGITALPGVDMTPDTLMREADQALYLAKRGGRNRTCVYEQSSPTS
ncbi:MAG TPA: GGDEF domain-containing protein [Anaerolineales bacterium]|jgi:diguanylate cyclase (GGDEF)-like protein